MADQPKKPLGPESVARDALLADPETQEIARTFGVPVEEYVDLVMEFRRDPNKEPELQLIDDEDWQASGVDAPSPEEVMEWLEAVANGEIDLTSPSLAINDELSTSREVEDKKAAAGLAAKLEAPKFGEARRAVVVDQNTPMGSVLKEQLLAQRNRAAMPNRPQKKKKPGPPKPR